MGFQKMYKFFTSLAPVHFEKFFCAYFSSVFCKLNSSEIGFRPFLSGLFSAVFDEVTVKERLVVEGGNSGTILSQFDGPVTFNKEVKFAGAVNAKSQLKVSFDAESTTTANGALVVSGGTGIAKNLNVGGNLNVTGTITGDVSGNITGNVTGTATTATNANNINISATTSSDTSQLTQL